MPAAGAGPEGTAPAVRRPARRQRAERRRRRGPARRPGGAWSPGWAPVRWPPHLRRHAELAGVDGRGFVAADEPVSLAVVGLAADGSADYGFHVLGAADWQWTRRGAGRRLPDRTAILHVGSISSWTPPGLRRRSPALVERLSATGSALISVDPNIRPMLAGGPVGAASATTPPPSGSGWTGWSPHADIVKVSAEDLRLAGARHARPRALDAAAQRWADRGPGTGAAHRRRRARCGSPAPAGRAAPADPRVSVADTVGAGDSLAAGLLDGLLDRGVTDRAALRRSPTRSCRALVDDAALVAALNCTRVGADPPTLAELDAARGSDDAGRRLRGIGSVGFEELSATAVRDRVLARRPEFWDTGRRRPRCTIRSGSTSSAASARSRGRPAGRTSDTSWAW